MKTRITAIILCLLILVSAIGYAESTNEKEPVVVLFTNDTHCGIDDNIGYAGVSAYEAAYEKAGYDVLIADCGDAVQGAAIGTISKGSYIIDIMNEVGYDVATIGNHEFDYGMARFLELAEMAEFPYTACNFLQADGNFATNQYVMLDAGGYKIAFVGIATPETVTKTSPTYFQNEAGEFIYSFCGGENGAELYEAVQTAVDAARADGAEIVIALAHLGIEASSAPWMSVNVIENTTGIDAVLDGHSHSVIRGEAVLNKAGEEVLLVSTGTKMQYLGALTIVEGEEGVELSADLHDESLFQDDETKEFISSIENNYKTLLEEVVAKSEIDLCINDPVVVTESGDPIRLIRSQETNLGNLCADAYRYATGADVAVVNGGGVRAELPAGDITYEDIIAVHPYGNTLMVIEITGQELLDFLELSVCLLPGENGSFQHVSGISFEVDMAVASSVVFDDIGAYAGITGDRRVRNVLVGGEPIDAEKVYTMASHNYTLSTSADAIVMFADNAVLQDEGTLDSQVLISYITEALGGVIGEQYADPYGDGRIVIVE